MKQQSTETAAAIREKSYELAALDSEFILGDSMRSTRLMLEYAKAEEHLRAWGVLSTVVVFGSARAGAGGGERAARRYEEARRFGRIASERGGALHTARQGRSNVICTGGGPGIMEGANRGAMEAGAPSIGLCISLPFEAEANPYVTPDLLLRFHYFAMRKMHLAARAAAMVAFPGGFGTFDEIFEILTLRQCRKMDPMPVVLFDEAFWKRVVNLEALVDEGMIAEEDLDLFVYADDAEEAWGKLIAGGLAID